jgi:protein O-GlcNAcase/histone acetyltransferase
VVSRCISVSHILSVNNVLQRRVTIWDNLNANDYDQRRLCLGPFSGRSSNLLCRLSGMLINPNCEFELNFIPLNTLGQWFRSLPINEIDDDDDDQENIYNIEKAFDRSLIQWLPEFNQIKSANDSQQISKIEYCPQAMSPKCHLISSLVTDEDSQDSINEIGNNSTKIHRMECDANGDLTLDDIRLLVELFYLPYQNGPNAQQMFSNFYWLRFNYHSQQNVRELFS